MVKNNTLMYMWCINPNKSGCDGDVVFLIYYLNTLYQLISKYRGTFCT